MLKQVSAGGQAASAAAAARGRETHLGPGTSEQFPGQRPDRAAGQGPLGDAAGQPPIGLPSEYVGAPRRPRQFRRGLRSALPTVLGLALFGAFVLASWLNWSIWPIFAVAYFLYLCWLVCWLVVLRVRRRLRIRRARRFRPPSLGG